MDKKNHGVNISQGTLEPRRLVKKKEARVILWTWIGLMIAILVMVCVSAKKGKTTADKQADLVAGANTPTLEGTFNQLSNVLNKITVSIYDGGTGQTSPLLLGSGIIVSRQCVLTNLHVAQNKTSLFVNIFYPQQATYPVAIFRSESSSDLALLQVTNNIDFPSAAALGDSDTVDVGDIVSAMGNAFGKGNLLVSGMIIDKSFSYAVNGQAYNNMFRTNINNYPGTCGGPLVNIRGEVIGINNSAGYSDNNYMGIGYATPINRAVVLLNATNLNAGQTAPTGSINPRIPASYMSAPLNQTNPYSLA